MVEQVSPQSDGSLAVVPPSELLRQRLTEGRGRLTVIAATTSVWVMDLLLARHLENNDAIDPAFKGWITDIERFGTVLFVVVTAGLVIALYRSNRRQLFDWGLTYLGFLCCR
jgi:hypothetical protein